MENKTKQKKQKTSTAETDHEPRSQKKINWSKNEKSIQNKTVGTLQD